MKCTSVNGTSANGLIRASPSSCIFVRAPTFAPASACRRQTTTARRAGGVITGPNADDDDDESEGSGSRKNNDKKYPIRPDIDPFRPKVAPQPQNNILRPWGGRGFVSVRVVQSLNRTYAVPVMTTQQLRSLLWRHFKREHGVFVDPAPGRRYILAILPIPATTNAKEVVEKSQAVDSVATSQPVDIAATIDDLDANNLDAETDDDNSAGIGDTDADDTEAELRYANAYYDEDEEDPYGLYSTNPVPKYQAQLQDAVMYINGLNARRRVEMRLAELDGNLPVFIELGAVPLHCTSKYGFR